MQGELAGVVITPDALMACTTHAMTTEAEEVMGLLLGDIRGPPDRAVAHVWRVVPQIRTDRRKDRVETSPEQMAHVSALADAASAKTGVPTRVVGWYHSHPHITVLPSHVDVNTQAMYQLLDAGFVGLIVSVFNTHANDKAQCTQVTAFQSQPAGASDTLLQSMNSAELEGLDDHTRSALRSSAAESMDAPGTWVRKEVPLSVHGSPEAAGMAATDYVEVQCMMLEEEICAHQQRCAASSFCGGGAGNNGSGADVAAALQQLHNAAHHQQAICQLMEMVLAPALKSTAALSSQAQLQSVQLQAQVVFAQREVQDAGKQEPPSLIQT